MTTIYRYTRNKDLLSSVITQDQIFYDDVPKFCSCDRYIRYSESKKTWMEIETDGHTIIKQNHTCPYIPRQLGVNNKTMTTRSRTCQVCFSEPSKSSKGWLVCEKCQELVLPTTNGMTPEKDLDQYNKYGTERI